MLIGARAEPSSAARQTPRLPRLPDCEGEVHFDAVARRAAADDWGHYVHHLPAAVLAAASPTDISRVVAYANDHRLTVAMRGQGHCVYGQAQARGGIVIDSSRLNAVGWHGHDELDAQPGALWGDVARRALERGLTPPVMPDALMLSVGGTLSAGGTGETSCGAGAQVDHVRELDVVTGRGDVVTCSASAQQELFHMVLAGLGQCGIIVRARLALIRAPAHIGLRAQTYDHSSTLVAEQSRLANAGTFPILAGEITKDGEGRWRVRSIIGTFSEAPAGDSTTVAYWEYLDRRTASVAATKAKGTPNPSLALVLPAEAAAAFLTAVMSDSETAAGIWRIEVLPMITARFTRPLHVLPSGDVAFTIRLQRRASAGNAPDHNAMLIANERLVDRCMAVGGKIYPPLAPGLSRDKWERHYGATWQRFAAAKKRFDPHHVLTPGIDLFA